MKIDQLQRYLREQDIDHALFFNLNAHQLDWAIPYLTGSDDIEYGCLIVGKRSCVLYTAGFEYDRLKKSLGVTVKKLNGDIFSTLVPSLKGSRFGLNHSSLAHQNALKLRRKLKGSLVDLSRPLLELRMTKTAQEIRLMQQAARIGDRLIGDCFSRFRQFKTEQEAARYLLRGCVDEGVELSFPTIVASGKHGAVPHHVPGKKLFKGFCVIDFGVKYKGYCSDMTRMIYLGKPSAKESELYDLLLSVQREGVKMLTPGATYQEVDAYLRSQLGNEEKHFIHSFGHSLGKDVHDPLPFQTKDFTFEKNMVFTMEPGLYYPRRFGMRIEDDVVVGKRPRVLTKTPKELIAIPFS